MVSKNSKLLHTVIIILRAVDSANTDPKILPNSPDVTKITCRKSIKYQIFMHASRHSRYNHVPVIRSPLKAGSSRDPIRKSNAMSITQWKTPVCTNKGVKNRNDWSGIFGLENPPKPHTSSREQPSKAVVVAVSKSVTASVFIVAASNAVSCVILRQTYRSFGGIKVVLRMQGVYRAPHCTRI